MSLSERARQWAAHDPDPDTRAMLLALVDAADQEELAAAMAGPLRFGTAGLRGQVGPGESRMNVATVTRASAGLAEWLRHQLGDAARPAVVVGCDARHGSAEFYRTTCEVLAAAGCRVIALPPAHPTPLTAFAVRALAADAGVMVTASHNPAPDNGYKVYLGGRVVDEDAARGVQLISPADTQIQAAIDAAPPADAVPRSADGIEPAPADLVDRYLDRVVSQVQVRETALPIVVTAMHGVGGALLVEALRRAGYQRVIPVAEQQDPHPDFPTVAFPNPEEDGALDLAIATATRHDAQLILALDPDADRCSVACRVNGEWTQLTGDRVGALLAEDIATAHAGSGQALAASIVSSEQLAVIADAHGLRYQPTLTGFKWIGRVPDVLFGYEEAIGYCPDPAAVRDKDGIATCLRVADLASRQDLASRGAQLDARYGAWVTAPLVLRLDDPARITAVVTRVLANPPSTLAGAPVTEIADLSAGYRGVPGTTGVLLRTAAADRVVMRPSGTEPKLKCYLQVVDPDPATARERVTRLRAETERLLGR